MSDQDKLCKYGVTDSDGYLHTCLSPDTHSYIAANSLDKHVYYWCKSCASMWDPGKFRQLTSEEVLIIEVMES